MGLDIRLQTMIRVNGKEYDSVEEMPAELRQAYERALAKPTAGRGKTVCRQVTSRDKIVFSGKEHTQMPGDVRGLYQRGMPAQDTNSDRIPDVIETGGPLGTGIAPKTTAALQAFDDIPPFVRPSTVQVTAGIVQPASSSSRMFLLGGILLALGLLLAILH